MPLRSWAVRARRWSSTTTWSPRTHANFASSSTRSRSRKNDGNAADYTPSPSEIDEALLAKKAIRSLFRHGDQNRLPLEFRKSLTSLSFGSNAFILAPQMSDTVLSCLVDETDITGQMNNVATGGGSLKFLIDNVRMLSALGYRWGRL